MTKARASCTASLSLPGTAPWFGHLCPHRPGTCFGDLWSPHKPAVCLGGEARLACGRTRAQGQGALAEAEAGGWEAPGCSHPRPSGALTRRMQDCEHFWLVSSGLGAQGSEAGGASGGEAGWPEAHGETLSQQTKPKQSRIHSARQDLTSWYRQGQQQGGPSVSHHRGLVVCPPSKEVQSSGIPVIAQGRPDP